MGAAGHPYEKFQKSESLIIPLALFELIATECLLKLSPRNGGMAMGANHGGAGDKSPQTWLNRGKTVKTTLKIAKFVIRTLTPGIYPGFLFRGYWLNPGVSQNLDPSLSQLFSLGNTVRTSL